jgi:hypothetical protein
LTTKRIHRTRIAGTPVDLPNLSEAAPGQPLVQGYTRTPARGDRRPHPSHPVSRSGRFAARLGGSVLALQLAQLWHAEPPSLRQVWWMHCRSVDFLRLGLAADHEDGKGRRMRWPGRVRGLRWCYGAVHLAGTAVCYLLNWLTAGPVRALFTVGGLVLLAWRL